MPLSYDRVGGYVKFVFMSKCLLIITVLATTTKKGDSIWAPVGKKKLVAQASVYHYMKKSE
jgi:hypothetical protein